MSLRSGPTAWLAYAAFRLGGAFLQIFPIDANLATARLFARLYGRFFSRHRRRAIDHIRAAYGEELSDRQVARVADRSLEHLAMFATEVICAPRLVTRWTWKRYVTPVGVEPFLRLIVEGRGALLLSGHYGNWELMGHVLTCLGFHVTAIMRPLDNVYLNAYLVRTRGAQGMELLNKKGASARAEEVVTSGGLLGVIADQDAGRKGVFARFFGRPASCYKMVGLLAMRARVPIVVGYARRLGGRFRYEIGVERMIHPEEWESRDAPLEWITQAYTAAIESIARRDPTQYLWVHRRWKTRPRAERGHCGHHGHHGHCGHDGHRDPGPGERRRAEHAAGSPSQGPG